MTGNRKSKGGYKNMKPKDFKQIKLLQEAGLSKNKTSKVVERSPNTVAFVYASDTFAEYQAAIRKRNADTKAKAEARAQHAAANANPILPEPGIQGEKVADIMLGEGSVPQPNPGEAHPVPTEGTTVLEVLNAINFHLKKMDKRLKAIEQAQAGKKRRFL